MNFYKIIIYIYIYKYYIIQYISSNIDFYHIILLLISDNLYFETKIGFLYFFFLFSNNILVYFINIMVIIFTFFSLALNLKYIKFIHMDSNDYMVYY